MNTEIHHPANLIWGGVFIEQVMFASEWHQLAAEGGLPRGSIQVQPVRGLILESFQRIQRIFPSIEIRQSSLHVVAMSVPLGLSFG